VTEQISSPGASTLISLKNIFCGSDRSVHQIEHGSGCLLVGHDVHGLVASVSSSHVVVAAAVDAASNTRVTRGGEGRGSCGSRGAHARARHGSAPNGHGEAFAVVLASALPAWGSRVACASGPWRGGGDGSVVAPAMCGGSTSTAATYGGSTSRPPSPPRRVFVHCPHRRVFTEKWGRRRSVLFTGAPPPPSPSTGDPCTKVRLQWRTAFPPPPLASLPCVTQRRWKKNGGEEREYAKMGCSPSHSRFFASACAIHWKDE
jgi:hypothetical protein